jgi:phosphoglycolate phosphatase
LHRVHRFDVKDSLGNEIVADLQGRSALLFDLDGTLIDSSADITRALSTILVEDGLEAPSRSETVRMVGDGAAMLVRRAYDRHGRTMPADALARFKACYHACCLEQTRAYAGIPELLADLSGRDLAVVTNKPEPFAQKVLDGLGLSRHFRAVLGPEAAGAPKPSPEHVRAALAVLGRRPDEAVVIGDGTTDVRAGRAAGAATIAVLWGYRDRATLAAEGPGALAADVAELRRLLGA